MSLWSTDNLNNGVAQTCAELNIPIVAYSPLGWGMLTGAVKSISDIPENDYRRHMNRLQEENFQQNMKLVNAVNSLASSKGAAPAQIALAWLRSLSEKPDMPTIIPIPGGTTVDKVVQNMTGPQLLSDEELAEVDAILQGNPIAGRRY